MTPSVISNLPFPHFFWLKKLKNINLLKLCATRFLSLSYSVTQTWVEVCRLQELLQDSGVPSKRTHTHTHTRTHWSWPVSLPRQVSVSESIQPFELRRGTLKLKRYNAWLPKVSKQRKPFFGMSKPCPWVTLHLLIKCILTQLKKQKLYFVYLFHINQYIYQYQSISSSF